MRQCKCGGVVGQWALADGKERWECRECKRRDTRPVDKSDGGEKIAENHGESKMKEGTCKA